MKNTVPNITALLFFSSFLLMPFQARAADSDKKLGLIARNGSWGFRPAKTYHKGRPRVLLIGDSVCSQYSRSVIQKLGEKADVDVWVTPMNLNSKELHAHLTEALNMAEYRVVHFNIGLHGWAKGRIPEGKYRSLMEAYIAVFKKNAPKATLIWADTTSISVSKEKADTLDPVNNVTIVKRNAIADEVMKENGIPVDDLYGLMKEHHNFKADRFHWKPAGVEILAKKVAEMIAGHLD